MSLAQPFRVWRHPGLPLQGWVGWYFLCPGSLLTGEAGVAYWLVALRLYSTCVSQALARPSALWGPANNSLDWALEPHILVFDCAQPTSPLYLSPRKLSCL